MLLRFDVSFKCARMNCAHYYVWRLFVIMSFGGHFTLSLIM